MRALLIATLAAAVSACQERHSRVLIGATLSNPGAAPVPDSIVVIADGKIRAAGARRDVPVPQDSVRSALSGKFLVPAGPPKIAPGEPASLEVREGSASGPVERRMNGGKWQP